MKIIDNLLSEKELELMKTIMMRKQDMPWYYNDYIASDRADDPMYYFTHRFYRQLPRGEGEKSNWFYIIEPILNNIDHRELIRCKANMYPSTPVITHHDPHVDLEYKHKGAIFYVNTNNGVTVLEDGTEIESIENRLLLFDSSKKHNSTSCTDAKVRVNINFNYF
tara:strand:+ start:937 stop:1431 length:495 start_codon:yes stop_codon:yes gene_type:complete